MFSTEATIIKTRAAIKDQGRKAFIKLPDDIDGDWVYAPLLVSVVKKNSFDSVYF